MENANVKLRVLVVEPDENHGDDTARTLRTMDLEPVVATSHFQALSMLEDDFFPLLIVSAEDTGLDGMEFCRIFRKRQFESGNDLSYIIITGDEWQRLSICESKIIADDFLIRPWLTCELKWRVKAGFHAISQMGYIRQMIYHDPESKALNRAGLKKSLREEINRLGRKQGWLSLAVLDFSQRDWMEISQGAESISKLKKTLLRFLDGSLRNYDLLGQLETERICIISGDCDYKCLTGLINRLQLAVKSFVVGSQFRGVKISLCGLAGSFIIDSTFGDSEKCFEHLWNWITSIEQLPEGIESSAVCLDKDGISSL